MSGWKDVGEWLKQNAGPGAALVGSLLVGNVPGAVAAGIAMATGATGEATPARVLETLQAEPGAMTRLRELAYQNEASIREHIRAMEELRLKDEQHQHEQTQLTIRAGDAAEDWFVRRTRPAQAWLSLGAALTYAFAKPEPSVEILLILMTLPWVYAGLRQVGKWAEVKAAAQRGGAR